MRRAAYLVVAVVAGWAAVASFAQSPPATTRNSAYDHLSLLSSPSPYPTTDFSEPRLSALDGPAAPGGWGGVPAPASARELGLGEHADDAEQLPTPADDDQEEVLSDVDVDQPEAGWYHPSYWLGPTPWDTSIELGLNGSAGNNEAMSIQTGGYIKRKSRFSKLDLSANYNRTTTGGESTQNNAQFNVRNDWLLDDRSPWTLFGSGEVFYDQFQAFDVQVSANMGVGYQFVDDADLTLIARLGGGASREFGDPEDDWVPESIIGFDYSQRVTNTQKFSAKFDYFPALDEIGDYRYEANVGWEIELVQPSNLSLKIAATDRYDSSPSGVNPHLVNYSVLLLLKL
jgi:putative salt-induced outer membrane protein YdiY